MDTSTKDEVRVIIALGILATIFVYLQIKQSGGGIIPFQQTVPSTTFYPAFQFLILSVLFVFGAYILMFTLALGIDSAKAGLEVSDFLKDFADIYFGMGSVILVILAIDGFLLLNQESAKGTVNYLFDAASYLAIITVSALSAIVIFSLTKFERYR